jgi:hypothetical protein
MISNTGTPRHGSPSNLISRHFLDRMASATGRIAAKLETAAGRCQGAVPAVGFQRLVRCNVLRAKHWTVGKKHGGSVTYRKVLFLSIRGPGCREVDTRTTILLEADFLGAGFCSRVLPLGSYQSLGDPWLYETRKLRTTDGEDGWSILLFGVRRSKSMAEKCRNCHGQLLHS